MTIETLGLGIAGIISTAAAVFLAWRIGLFLLGSIVSTIRSNWK